MMLPSYWMIMPRIEIYSSPLCPWCWRARLLLRNMGVKYDKIPIRMYAGIKLPTANFRTMVSRSGGDSTVPQIFVDGTYLGTDDDLDELNKDGRLQQILSGNLPVPTPER
jgi:glutaredoxin 3